MGVEFPEAGLVNRAVRDCDVLLCGSWRKPSNLGFQPERSRELLSLRFLRPGKMPDRRDRQDACVTLPLAPRLRQFHRRVIENED